MDDIWWEAPRVLAGLLMLTVAMWVMALDPRSRLMQVFALFMVVRGVVNILLRFTPEALDGSPTPMTDLVNYYQIALPFLALMFAFHLLWPRAKATKWSIGALVVMTIFEFWYLFDHGIWYADAPGNWMYQVIGLQAITYLVVAHALLRDREAPLTHFVAGVSFMLFPVFAAAADLTIIAFRYATIPDYVVSEGFRPTAIIRIVSLVYAAIIVALTMRRWDTKHRWAHFALGAAVVGGILPTFIGEATGVHWFTASKPFNGLFSAAMPVAIGWALTSQGFYAHSGTRRLAAWLATSLFTIVWLLIIGALYATVEGATVVAAIAGSLALTVLFFLLVQSTFSREDQPNILR